MDLFSSPHRYKKRPEITEEKEGNSKQNEEDFVK
jgi:hypothetical protein